MFVQWQNQLPMYFIKYIPVIKQHMIVQRLEKKKSLGELQQSPVIIIRACPPELQALREHRWHNIHLCAFNIHDTDMELNECLSTWNSRNTGEWRLWRPQACNHLRTHREEWSKSNSCKAVRWGDKHPCGSPAELWRRPGGPPSFRGLWSWPWEGQSHQTFSALV